VLYVATQNRQPAAITELAGPAQTTAPEISGARSCRIGAFDVAVAEASHTAFGLAVGRRRLGWRRDGPRSTSPITKPWGPRGVIATGKASKRKCSSPASSTCRTPTPNVSDRDAAARTVKSMAGDVGHDHRTPRNKAMRSSPRAPTGPAITSQRRRERRRRARISDTSRSSARYRRVATDGGRASPATQRHHRLGARARPRPPRRNAEPVVRGRHAPGRGPPSDDTMTRRQGHRSPPTYDRPHAIEAPPSTAQTAARRKVRVPAAAGIAAIHAPCSWCAREQDIRRPLRGHGAGNGKPELAIFGNTVRPTRPRWRRASSARSFTRTRDVGCRARVDTTGCIAKEYTERVVVELRTTMSAPTCWRRRGA